MTEKDPEEQATSTKPAPPARRPLEQTSDDTDRGWGEHPDEDEHERWLREQRPPHWG